MNMEEPTSHEKSLAPFSNLSKNGLFAMYVESRHVILFC